MAVPKRWTWVRTVGKCETCGREWAGRNGLSCAASHGKATGHYTWAETTTRTEYGDPLAGDPRQADLFDLGKESQDVEADH